MQEVRLAITREQGLKRYGYLKSYTVNQIRFYREAGGVFAGVSYSFKILAEGRILFSGGLGIEPGYLYRQLDEEDFDNLLPVLKRKRVKRLTFDCLLYEGATLLAQGEVEVVSRLSFNYLLLEDGSDISIEGGILIQEG